MDTDNKKQRISDAQAYIVSGEYARAEKKGEEEGRVERVEDTSYRVKEDRERSQRVLADFLGGKMFESGEGEE